MIILGLHGGVTLNQHDPAAAIIRNGELVATIEEERLNRVKGPRGYLPIYAIRACLREAQISIRDVNLVVQAGATYDDMPERVRKYLTYYFGYAPPVRMIDHQLSHLAAGFYHSGFERAMCLSYDAFGDRQSAALAVGNADGLRVLESRDSSNSLGLFYATMTSFLGFRPAEGEYMVMGLSAYGQEQYDLSPFARPVAEGFHVDHSFVRSDVKSVYEPFASDKLIKLLGEARAPGSPITERHRNIAYATQKALEACAEALVTHLHKITGESDLCLSGGIALNCTANLKLRKLPFVRKMFVHPSASDRGLAVGAALQASFEEGIRAKPLKHVYYGPSYSNDDIRAALKLTGMSVEDLSDPAVATAEMLADGKIVGWFQGRSEFGPRALGHRSILADPRLSTMKDEINKRVKFRDEFRPFAPAVAQSFASIPFDIDHPSPFMTVAFPVRKEWQAKLPAITHVNETARVQTVSSEQSPEFDALLGAFGKITGTPVVLNTSFNIKGQPIIETPLEALATFAATGLDALVMGSYVVRKPQRPAR